MYVVNLLLLDFVHILIDKPLSAVLDYLEPDFFGECMVIGIFRYALYCLLPSSRFAHVLITINRIWAVTFPFHYSRRHTFKVAVLLCVSSVIVIHVGGLVTTVGLISSAVCRQGEFSSLQIIRVLQYGELGFTVLCGVSIVVSYPVLCYKYRFYMAKRKKFSKTAVLAYPISTVSAVQERSQHSHDSGQHAFVFLTAVTFIVFVTWVPLDICALYAGRNATDLSRYMGTTFSALQELLDPVFFVLALREVRTAVKIHLLRLFRKSSVVYS